MAYEQRPTVAAGASPAEVPSRRRLRINWIHHRPNLSGGVKSNRLIAEAMVRRGHDVRVFYVAAPRKRPSVRHPRQWMRTLWRDYGFRVEGTHLESSTAALFPVGHEPILDADVPDADVTVGTWWETMEWVRDFSPSKGLKAYFIRGHELYGGPPDRVRATYRLPCLKFVSSRWLQRLLADEYASPDAVLVPNGVDWSQFGTAPRQMPREPVVGMLYGTPPLKGANEAFEALRMLDARVPGVRAEAFGRSPMSREHRPAPNLRYHFRPSQSDIPELYKRTSCWLLPSRLEGFGMPGLEAAACGCPVVATRCGGPEDYVEDGTSGFLVPVNDARAMADAMERVLTASPEEWRAMSAASYGIARRFDWDRSAVLLEDAITSALSQGRASGPLSGR